MAGKDLTLKLEIDSTSGQKKLKDIAAQLKDLETTSFGKGLPAASKEMEKLAKEAAEAAEEYRKLVDVSKLDAERLKALTAAKKRASDREMKEIADASRADAERLSRRIRAEKQLIASMNKTHQFSMRMQKQRSAEINKDHSEALRMHKQIIGEVDKTTKKVDKTNEKMKKQVGIIEGIKKHLFTLRSYWLAISAAVSIATISVVKFFKAGFMSVENFRLSVASMAASITTFSDLSAGNVAEVYANAVIYSEELALKMELINVRTIATGEQLRAMNETFIQQGVLLDVNSKKQEDAFVAVANAISLITQGQNQEIQMRQEVRGLLSGDIRATNLLARMIDTKLGGELKKNIKLWKQQGTLLINLGKHLEGFKAGSADLASTWAALSTTFETILNRFFRKGFQPIYSDIIEKSLEISRSMLVQKETSDGISDSLRMGMSKAWETIKNTVQVVLDLFWWMKQPLQLVWEFVKVIADAFGHFFALIAPITSRFRDLTKSVQSTVMAILRLGEAAWRIASFDFAGAKEQFKQAKAEWKESGKMLGKAFGEGLGLEIALSLADYIDPVFKPKLKGELPTLGMGASEEGLKKAEDWFKTWEKMEEENQTNRIKIKYDGYAQSVMLLELEKNKMVEVYGEQESIIEHFELKLALLNRKEEKRKKEAHDKLIEYISSERENKTRAIMEEINLHLKSAKSQEELNKLRKAGQAELNALEKEALDIRKKNHEQILQFTSTELENKIRAIDIEKEKLLELATSYAEQAAIYEAAAQKKAELQDIPAMEEWAASSITILEQVDAVAIKAAESFSTGFTDAFFDFAEGTKSAGDAFRDFAVSFFNQLTRMIMQQFILNTIKDLMGTTSTTASAKAVAGNAAETASVAVLTNAYIALGVAKTFAGVGGGGGAAIPAAKGMVVSNGQKMMEYANGGVIDRPTTFPMRNGTGLMGEAGPEAIMPLKRGKGGRLGVESNGDKDVQIMPQEVNIVNSFNPNMLEEFLASSKGQDAIVNVIGNRSQTIKRIIR